MYHDPTPGFPTELTQADLDHFIDDWLGGGYFPGVPVEALLRAGYSQAVRRARERQVPIVSLWMKTPNAPFHVFVNETAQQVTVILVTPVPALDSPPSALRTQPSSMFAVKVREEDDDEDADVVGEFDGGEVVRVPVRQRVSMSVEEEPTS